MQIFLKLGLVEVLDSGTFYMSNIELLIGQSSTEAAKGEGSKTRLFLRSGQVADIFRHSSTRDRDRVRERDREGAPLKQGTLPIPMAVTRMFFVGRGTGRPTGPPFPFFGTSTRKTGRYIAPAPGSREGHSHHPVWGVGGFEKVEKPTHPPESAEKGEEKGTERRHHSTAAAPPPTYQGRFSLEVLNSCEITSEHVGKVWISSIASFQILLIVGRGIFDAVVIFPTDFMQRIDFAFVGSILRGKPDLVTAEYGIF